MMNNSQLHNQLHGTQAPSSPLGDPSPPCPVEVPVEDPSHTPTSSPSPGSSPRSSQSESSADADLEPSMSMDTSPSSSSSSSGTESGEEEVIGTVTRAHQETFMYNQEQGSPSSLAEQRRSPSATERAHMDSKTMEERQDTWNNHRNNVAKVTAHGNNRLTPNSQAETSDGHPSIPLMDNAPRHCPVQLSNAAPSGHCPVTGHGMPHRPLNSRENGCRGPAWRGGNRMYLVSATPDSLCAFQADHVC